jgi:DNA polymerase III epsilon subunit-like protein
VKLLVLDTETSGTDPQVHSLLTIGALVWDDGTFGDEIELRVVEREMVIDAEAMAINRINIDLHRRGGIEPRLAATELSSFVRRHFFGPHGPDPAVLCGHNIAFDIGFLKRLFNLAEIRYDLYFSHRALDTASVLRFLALARRIPPDLVSSSKAFAHFGIQFSHDTRHTALGDARATAELLNRLIELERTPL